MKKLIFFFLPLVLSACSATNDMGMKITNKNPRGISFVNVVKEDRVKAYREAEKHCAKYYKVTRKLKSDTQEQKDEIEAAMSTISFECLKPSS